MSMIPIKFRGSSRASVTMNLHFSRCVKYSSYKTWEQLLKYFFYIKCLLIVHFSETIDIKSHCKSHCKGIEKYTKVAVIFDKVYILYVVRICGIRNNVEHLCNSNLLLYSMYICTSRNLLQCCTSNSNVV